MLRIVQFLACLAVLNQVNCFFNPLASLLLDSPAMLPFDEVLEETKMLAAVKQMGGGDLEDVLLAPFGKIQVAEQQQQQQQQQQRQQEQQQQLTRKQQRQQQQQLEQQRQQELEREQERKRQQQEQEQRTQQQQREQQQKQQQREQRRQQKEQQLKQDQQKTEQQQQQQQQQKLQQQQPKQQQIKQFDQWQIQVLDQDGQERLEGRVSENEEILHDFADLKQRMDYIRDKIVRTIQVAKSNIEDHQRQADKQIQTLVLEQQRLQQQIRLLEQQKEQQQQLQQLQLPEQQQDDLMMLRARSPLSRLSDELIMPRRMFQTDRMLDAMMPMPIVAMKIDTIDQISPLSLLNQISNSIMQNPLLPLSKPSETQSCDQVHGKAMDAHRENRIRIQHTLIKQTTYRFESSTCQCQQQQQKQQQQKQQQQLQQQQALEHCSLAYSRPDQQTCKVVELNNRQQQAFANNCEALEACRAQGAQCDGVYHDGAKYYLIECKQQGQRIATRPGLGAEYIIQLRSCF